MLVGLAGVARADVPSAERDVRAKVAALETQLAEMKAAQNSAWLNERRAEEVKTLIRDVLSDADTRASLLETGASAGHNGEHFFLASDDGGFLLEIMGGIQMRYVAGFQDRGFEGDDPNTGDPVVSGIADANEFGLEFPRVKVRFAGHIADPRLGYAIELFIDGANNNVTSDEIIISYEVMDGVTAWIGEDKAPFLREELTLPYNSLAVDRSYMNEVFTMGVVQGVGLKIDGETVFDLPLKISAMINDGARSGDGGTAVNPLTQGVGFAGSSVDPDTGDEFNIGRSTSKLFNEDATDFAVSVRVDVKIAGEWGQMDDFSAWEGEDFAAFIGAAIHWEAGETGDSFNNNNFFTWTLDGSIETNGLGLYAAIVGQSTDNDGTVFDPVAFAPASASDHDLWGAVIQGGYMIPNCSLEPFVRYEYIDFDNALGSTIDEANIVTFGANYYLDGHNAKVTVDVVWALDPLPLSSSQLSILADDHDSNDQIVLRAQLQLLF